MPHHLHLIPYFPLTVLAFYTTVIVGSDYGLIPSLWDMIDWLSVIYHQFGPPALFISSFLESLAYIGLYFPGAAVIALAVIVSDGQWMTFIEISLIVSIAIAFGAVTSAWMGSQKYVRARMQDQLEPDSWQTWAWFIFANWHPVAVGLWFFKRGFQNQTIMPFAPLVIPIMFSWGMVCCLVIYSLREYAESEEVWPVFLIIGIWIVGDFLIRYYRRKTIKV